MLRMPMVLYFLSTGKVSTRQKLEGVYASGREFGWDVQVIEPGATERKAMELVRFWEPDGVIVECGSEQNHFDPRIFGKTPVVFLDRNPKTLDGPAFCVTHDSAETGIAVSVEPERRGESGFALVAPEPLFRPWDVGVGGQPQRKKLPRGDPGRFSGIVRQAEGGSAKGLRIAVEEDDGCPPEYPRIEVVLLGSALDDDAVRFPEPDQLHRLAFRRARFDDLHVPAEFAAAGVDAFELLAGGDLAGRLEIENHRHAKHYSIFRKRC